MANAATTSRRLGRFDLVRELGRGAQGAVWLATDPHLGRQVALKTLHVGSASVQALLDEARIVSTLTHPNIVTLYDAGEHEGMPYLVLEYVEGRTLGAVLREQGKFGTGRALEIAAALAQGVAYAHERGIVHRDLKPGNVMLTADGVPRLMDFGIAQRGAGGAHDELAGTPSYMAPEYIAGAAYSPAADVFSLGVVLYEMLTGAPPASGADAQQTLTRIVHQPFVPPSKANPAVDERVDALVMKALAKQPAERFDNAARFAEALGACLAPAPPDATPQGTQAAVEFLLRRIRHQSEFPALSETIGAINKVAGSERAPASALCNAILKDFALTNRLLKQVNAASFRQFGGAISTVSRAVSVVGFESVRNLATSLLLFEHLHDRSNAAALREEAVAAYFSGVLARTLFGAAGVQDAEQAFICAMFHRLGRMLATFYLHEEAQTVARLAQTRGWDEARASAEVLGVSYEELGVAVGRSWNLPETIVASMRALAGPPRRRPAQDAERLRLLAALANELTDAARERDDALRTARLDKLATRYGPATGATAGSLASALQSSAVMLAREASALGIATARSALLANAQRCGAPEPAPEPVADADTVKLVAQTRLPEDAPTPPLAGAGGAVPPSRNAALAAGLQDITAALVGEFELGDLLRIILETMFRGIGFRRVLLFIAGAKKPALRLRFGFGADTEALLQRGLEVPLAGKDLFAAALGQGADLLIEDLAAPKIAPYVPQWHRDALGRPAGMMLLPIASRGRTVGLIYADADDAACLRFSAEELSLLKALRNQALLAMRQKG